MNKAELKRKILSLLAPRVSCVVCGRTIGPAAHGACARCLPPRLALPLPLGVPSAAPFAYDGAVRELLLRLKRAADRPTAACLAHAMASVLPVSGAGWVFVPVPLHPRRLKARGHNQSRLLCEELSALTGYPIADALARAVDTPP